MRDIVYFDLETRHSAAEVGGWHNTAEMRLSVGVTYSTASGKYTIYSEEMVDDLIRQLSQADLVVGYNHEHFDYGVLQRYTMWNMIDITNNLDLCKDIEQRGGVRVKLDSVAAASIGSSKTGNFQTGTADFPERLLPGSSQAVLEKRQGETGSRPGQGQNPPRPALRFESPRGNARSPAGSGPHQPPISQAATMRMPSASSRKPFSAPAIP